MKNPLIYLLAFTTLPMAISTAAGTYSVTEVGPSGVDARAFGISSNGIITGDSGDSSAAHGFLYANGTFADLGVAANPAGGNYPISIGYSVNSHGDVAGESFTPSAYPGTAFIYTGGQLHAIGPTGNRGGQATALNDAGQVAGIFVTSNGQDRHAFLYSNGTSIDLGTLGGSTSEARAINAAGHVAGSAFLTGDAASHAFIYSNGIMNDLGFAGTATGINASDQVTGYAYDSEQVSHAFLYSNGTVKDLGTLGESYSFGYGINDNGDVVGEYVLPDNSTFHAFIDAKGMMTDLNTLIDPSAGWTLNSAKGINNLGEIVGYGTNASGQTRGFLLTPSAISAAAPTPEPATAATLLLGSAILLRRRCRRK